jgi:hypothetical protein
MRIDARRSPPRMAADNNRFGAQRKSRQNAPSGEAKTIRQTGAGGAPHAA